MGLDSRSSGSGRARSDAPSWRKSQEEEISPPKNKQSLLSATLEDLAAKNNLVLPEKGGADVMVAVADVNSGMQHSSIHVEDAKKE